jgi:hypothetical protein
MWDFRQALRVQGHGVRLMPAQEVKAQVQTNYSDYIDAKAIAEAVQRLYCSENRSTKRHHLCGRTLVTTSVIREENIF